MAKDEKKEKKENRKVVNKKEEKPFVVNPEKLKVAKDIIHAVINAASFPKLSPEAFTKIATDFNVPEKSLKVICDKMKKFYSVLAKGKKEKKGKEVDEKLQAQIKEATISTAMNLAQKLFKNPATFIKMVVVKKSKKENNNANGKAFFKILNKEYFLCWDYRNGDLYVGSTLHEVTEAMKK